MYRLTEAYGSGKKAARSLSTLTDYLKDIPEALLGGKGTVEESDMRNKDLSSCGGAACGSDAFLIFMCREERLFKVLRSESIAPVQGERRGGQER